MKVENWKPFCLSVWNGFLVHIKKKKAKSWDFGCESSRKPNLEICKTLNPG
ncbi:hypothetical protein Fmac_007054 [Flemingia macrophylla]|uniref:Uncharacterized protein n=1 Tax=Flemingia macrophylla TaxID=520843 RepID=A0ABD1NCD6_9FABA